MVCYYELSMCTWKIYVYSDFWVGYSIDVCSAYVPSLSPKAIVSLFKKTILDFFSFGCPLLEGLSLSFKYFFLSLVVRWVTVEEIRVFQTLVNDDT